MRRIASLALIALTVSAMGCSTPQDQKTVADPIRPLCEFSGLTPTSPEWSKCMATMPVNPDRDLLAATIKARADAEASGAPDIRADFSKRSAPIFAESLRRSRARIAQAASTGTADCDAWHWNSDKAACQP
jgi:hypothetical protein